MSKSEIFERKFNVEGVVILIGVNDKSFRISTPSKEDTLLNLEMTSVVTFQCSNKLYGRYLRKAITFIPVFESLLGYRNYHNNSKQAKGFSSESLHWNPSTYNKPPASNWNIKLELSKDVVMPKYLHATYWWAYTSPWAVKFWEREFLVNAILWGNFKRLRNIALEEILTCRKATAASVQGSHSSKSPGLNVLQIACVYGNFTQELLSNYLTNNDKMHVVDVTEIQLLNLNQKLLETANTIESLPNSEKHRTIHLQQQDSSKMTAYTDDSMDCVYLFFLLHEMPLDVRRNTVKEALRVLKPQTGRLIVVDYHKVSSPFNPFRYIMRSILTILEPFAIDLWNSSLQELFDSSVPQSKYKKHQHELFFGGLYQKFIVSKVK